MRMRWLNRNNRNKEGFTLIEVVIVTAMAAVISLALYSTLSNGLRIWKKVNDSSVEEDIGFFLARMNTDVRNSFVFKTIPFTGTAEHVDIPTLVMFPQSHAKTIGKVVYAFDPYAHTLTRRSWDYSRISREAQGAAAQSLQSVKRAGFQYYYYDPEKKDYLWVQEWQRKSLPVAVRVEIELNGREGITARTMRIPVEANDEKQG